MSGVINGVSSQAATNNMREVLAMVLQALDRDAAEGRGIRGEMAAELRAAMEAQSVSVPVELLGRAAILLQDSISPPEGCSDFDDWTKQGNAIAAQLRAMLAAAPAQPAAQREWPDDEIVDAWKWCEENGGTPAEFLSHSLLVKRSRVLGRPLTWREAIELTAMTTNMPDELRDKLLAIDDEPDAAAHDQGEVQRLREALRKADDVLAALTACTTPLVRLERKYGKDWCRAIDQIRSELIAASTGQEV